MKSIRITIAIFLFSILCVLLVQFVGKTTVEKDLRSQYLKAGEFTLLSSKGEVSLSDYKGKPVILYFGYTFCPDVCPVGLAVIRDALKSDPALKGTPVLFVTLDPERDSLKRLAEYTAFFHPNIVSLTGNLEAIKSVVGAYGGFFKKSAPSIKEAIDDNYTVDHSAYYYIIDSEGRLIRVLDHNVKANEIAKVLISLQ